MKKIKLIIFFIFIFIIFYFFITIDLLSFFKIYKIQLILIFSFYLILNSILKRGKFILLIITLIATIFYFYIYPNFLEKRILFSETFKKESLNKLLNINLKIESGYFKIFGEKINEDFIFDYTSYKKIYLYSEILKDKTNYFLLQNVIKRYINNSDEYNLIVNENKILNLNIKGKSLNYELDFSNILLKEFFLNSESSFIEIKLPKNQNELFIKINVKPSFIKIGLRKNYNVELNLKSKNITSNLIDLGFKKKNHNIYYLEGGKNKIFIEINTISSYIDFYFLD